MSKEILIKIHKSYRWVVALCDSDLIGKTLEQGKICLQITERFFKGDEYEPPKLKEIIHDCLVEDATFYIVGEKSVKLAKYLEIIDEKGIKNINGVPFALILL